MATESVLEEPALIYRPFREEEVERLTTYRQDVERFTAMDFFTDPTRSMGPKKPGEVRRFSLNDVNDEATHAVMGIFRSLFTHNEPSSFRSIVKLVKSHVKHSERRQDALDDLNRLLRWEQDELKRTPIRLLRGDVEFTPVENIKAHLHGVYLHKDPARRRELQPFPSDLSRAEMLGKVYVLAQVYWIGRNVVVAILEEPRVLMTGSTKAA